MAKTALPPSPLPQPTVASSPPESENSSRLYEADPALGSVVSYPTRCRAWGDSSYRGNCDGTLFKELVLRLRPSSVADPMMGSGTTRDVIAGLNRTTGTRIAYWGGDLRAGFDLERTPIPNRFAFIWLHPPYWNIVRYSENPADLSNSETWEDFSMRLANCLLRCVEALGAGGHLAVLVGDIRKQGRYYSMAAEILRHRGAFGELRSIIVKVQHNCTSDRKLYPGSVHIPIRHEYCLLFERAR